MKLLIFSRLELTCEKSRVFTVTYGDTAGASETVLVNEESQGSTATTESEKVKVKIRRMEINLDPDEGPFTVDKIAEYEWPSRDDQARPAATRAETLMIQEQISQYLGVKSFKRKYPDLDRRMVDMEERNFLRENGLVSESMCDMGESTNVILEKNSLAHFRHSFVSQGSQQFQAPKYLT